jgi:hypothetical protein
MVAAGSVVVVVAVVAAGLESAELMAPIRLAGEPTHASHGRLVGLVGLVGHGRGVWGSWLIVVRLGDSWALGAG